MFRPLILTRVFFVALATAFGFWANHVWPLGASDKAPFLEPGTNSTIVAFILAILVVVLEYSLRTVSTKHLILASFGLLLGLLTARLIYQTIPNSILAPEKALAACSLLFGYFGVVTALKHADQISLNQFRFILSNPELGGQTRLLDTSVIIDGRIEELLANGFLSGSIVCPSFVIDELQALADSADPLKRTKGRRGLTILKSIQDKYAGLQILEKNYPGLSDVDHKLLELAKELNAQVVTNDTNLQKVADLHKVSFLNVNALADILRPTLFVGETFTLSIIREGKEAGQGIGYLPDGTMVVVDDGKRSIGQDVEVAVTSILQTPTGRMIFARSVSSENHVNV
jgi:uncharacterized protein YacL